MKKTKDDADITRQKILDAAMKIFSRDGYANARLEDIAAAAGVTRGAVYHHFGGKPEVYTALLNERFHEANSFFGELAAKGGTPKELLKRLTVGLLAYLEENEDYRTVQELVLFKTAYIPELEEGMQYKVKSTAAMVDYFEEIIKKGIACGEFKKEIDSRVAAISLLGMVSGASTLWLMDHHLFSIQNCAEKIIDLFIEGIGK
ncbi:MAG: TetR family transcriptional regulator [Clostridia bacterium]|nr:TetR family transcriptional regulator [Clostridia bacterium]